MSEYYLLLVIILFSLAAIDLVVGVSNDAVNFLNSAIGSKAAPKWLIFSIAAIGILIGTTFSDGMMEVARKGVFNPQMFVFSDVMLIFLAVTLTDIIILDLFNTFGYPTSTTVSIVFELLGSSVSVAFVKMKMTGETLGNLGKYINSEKALAIILGILVSVAIAFVIGITIHWLTRVLFTFRYDKRLKYFGSMYGGLAIAVITYFLIVIGAKDAVFMTDELKLWISSHMAVIFIYSFVVWSVILQILYMLFKIDILKIIVLAGTFSLAMAFAGNDLVNFIGVSVAGLVSFKAWVVSGIPADMFNMGILSGKVKTPPLILLSAGVIMVIALIFSKKSRSVVKTSVDLSRQSEGEERFESTAISRFVVSASVGLSQTIGKVIPPGFINKVSSRFEPVNTDSSISAIDLPAFDKLRAASNLILASILISLGTSLKLPLSTTYVTFMVAMGTSLADKAWGRESAVYRVTGVFSVIGGWFLTAFVAFTASFIMAQILFWGGKIAVFIMFAFVIFIIIRSNIFFRKKNHKNIEDDEDEISESGENTIKIIEKCNKSTVKAIISTSKAYFLCFQGFFNDDKQQLKSALEETEKFNIRAKDLKNNVFKNIQKLQQDQVDTGHFYVQTIDYLREMAHSINFVVLPTYKHYENKHKPFNEDQINELNEFGIELNNFFNFALYILKEKRFDSLDELIEKRNFLVEKLKVLEKSQIRRIKNNVVSTKNSVLFFNIISETKTLLLNLINVVKAQRDFIKETKISTD